MAFEHQSQRFAAARRSLMLPHRDGVTSAIASALQACNIGFRNLRPGQLDEHAAKWLDALQALIGPAPTGGNPDSDREHWHARAAELDVEQQSDLSRLVDELAHWFHSNAR